MSDQPVAASAGIHEVLVPREIVNADSVYVVAWLADDGALVDAGADICNIETSKTAVVVAAPHAGYVRHRAAAGDEVPVGGVLGYVTGDPHSPLPSPEPPAAADVETTISPKALRRIQELGLDPALFKGKGLVRERDVIELAATLRAEGETARGVRAPVTVQPLSAVQRRVAAAMQQSTSVPVAYLTREIDIGVTRERALTVSREAKMLISPVDLLVAAVARAAVEHPVFNAVLAPQFQLHVFQQVHVGVAVDVDNDLYVVVVKDAAAKPLAAIAAELRQMQMLALKRTLHAEQVTGGTITVTSMLGRGVHRFQPILPPDQSAIIALSDPLPGTSRAELTLGFDHRVANGSQAAAFVAVIERELHGATV